MAIYIYIPLPPPFGPQNGLIPYKRYETLVLRQTGVRRLRVSSRQRKQINLFTYVNKYWRNSLTIGGRQTWIDRYSGVGMITFDKGVIESTPKMWYVRAATLGLYNELYVDGHVVVPDPPSYTMNSTIQVYTWYNEVVTTTNRITGGSEPTDVCFAWISPPNQVWSEPVRQKWQPMGMQLLQQNGVEVSPGIWDYTQYWSDPYAAARNHETPVRIWWMGLNLNQPVGPLAIDTTAAP